MQPKNSGPDNVICREGAGSIVGCTGHSRWYAAPQGSSKCILLLHNIEAREGSLLYEMLWFSHKEIVSYPQSQHPYNPCHKAPPGLVSVRMSCLFIIQPRSSARELLIHQTTGELLWWGESQGMPVDTNTELWSVLWWQRTGGVPLGQILQLLW
jgi:hypothetical protein